MKTLPFIALFRAVELNLYTYMWMQGSRLSRIRENQRRSRARKREYLEDLEGRWKKCQELGVQANVELQKAARRVIEENALLRRILAELGWETARVEKRLREMAIADGNDYNASCCDNGCGEPSGSGLDGVGRAMAVSLDNPQLPQPPSEISNIQNILEGGITGHPVNSDVLPPAFNPIFDMSILEPSPDHESPFDIAQFLESVMHPPRKHTTSTPPSRLTSIPCPSSIYLPYPHPLATLLSRQIRKHPLAPAHHLLQPRTRQPHRL